MQRRPAAPPARPGSGLQPRIIAALLFLALALPGVKMIADAQASGLPWQVVLIDSGLWSSRILVLVLAVTPFRQLYRAHWLARHRRMIGLFAAFYALIHVVAYVIQADFNWPAVFAEVFGRAYLAIGLIATILLIPLTATSTQSAMRRMGAKAWKNLHKIVYPTVFLALLHFYLTGKIDPWEAILQVGLFLWLMLYRLMPQGGPRSAAPSLTSLAAVGLLATLLTLGIDFGHFQFTTGVGASRLLPVYLHPADYGLRPGHIMAMVSVALLLVRAILPLIQTPRRRPA